MGMKQGPTAANTVKKNLSMLFNFAAKKLAYVGPNPARHADKLKTNPDGYHTWTYEEIDRFLKRHGPGTISKAPRAGHKSPSRAVARFEYRHVTARLARRRMAAR